MSLLSQLLSKSRSLFSPEVPDRYTRKWAKFEEVVRVLSANLREIEDRWEGGQVQSITVQVLEKKKCHSPVHSISCAYRVP